MVIRGRECGHITAAVHETESMLANFNVATVMLFALRLALLRQFFISINKAARVTDIKRNVILTKFGDQILP